MIRVSSPARIIYLKFRLLLSLYWILNDVGKGMRYLKQILIVIAYVVICVPYSKGQLLENDSLNGFKLCDYNNVRDLAYLSARVYGNVLEESQDTTPSKLFPESDYAKKTGHFEIIKTYKRGGFYAVLFRSKKSNMYVLTYRGTETFSYMDWIADMVQASSDYMKIATPQYNQAVIVAGYLKDKLGTDSLILTGHSLGGGMAQTAALAHGLSAVCFEAAGITQNTLNRYGISVDQVSEHKKNILHVNVRWDPLSDTDGRKNTKSPFKRTLQYGNKTIWLKAIAGTQLAANPLRIINHMYQTVVYQVARKRFM